MVFGYVAKKTIQTISMTEEDAPAFNFIKVEKLN